MENEEQEKKAKKTLRLFSWDRQLVDPRDSGSVAYDIAARLGLDLRYAERRHVSPWVVEDIVEW